MLDVGGGHGELLAAILQAHPVLRGVLFEPPHAVSGAQACLDEADVSPRCTVVAGSFLAAIPDGADMVLLKSVLHNSADDRCAEILRNRRNALAGRARLVVIERLMPETMRSPAADAALARADLNMLVGLGGRERTRAEFEALLAAAGFKPTRIATTGTEFRVIEAVPDLSATSGASRRRKAACSSSPASLESPDRRDRHR